MVYNEDARSIDYDDKWQILKAKFILKSQSFKEKNIQDFIAMLENI